jgi:2,4-dienoyl-CoA reductase-like NADH-dependent reductase (Old Yellow Enzyme family)/thioredoxin reductase
MKKLEHLLQPIRVRNLEIPNRVVMPPMGSNLGNTDGTVSEANLAYFKRRVQSGAGFIITEITSVHPDGTASPRTLCIYDDRFIPGLAKMADIVHQQGAKIAMQLHHVGREGYYLLKEGKALAPSAIASYIYRVKPKEMTIEDIQETITAFGQGARRAQEAGFDAVELHAAHGYLLMQFLSGHCNQRSDEYGGDFAGRARFVVECLQEVRKQVGEDFPISIRISAEEIIKDGYTVEDMQSIMPALVEAGADIIHVSFGTHGSPGGITSAPVEYESGFKVELARKIKEVVKVPVIAVGRFTDPFMADAIIARGDADMIAFGRQHLADPDFLINARSGRAQETFPCLACNQGCIERLLFEQGSIRCAINPETGQELEYPVQAAEKSKKVWVIGGGPGGLTAASEAARLGHEVTLFEADKEAGGQVLLAARVPYKEVYGGWIEVLTARAIKYGAKIITGQEVSKEMIRGGQPDEIILASGARPVKPDIPGINLPHVCQAEEILKGAVAPREAVVILGSGLVGMETADYLREKGIKNISIVDTEARSPVSTLTSHGYMLHKRLRTAGVKFLFNSQVNEIRDDSILLHRDPDKQQELKPVQQVIIATGSSGRNHLEDFLKQENVPYYLIGDARKPRRIIEAVEEGARAAWHL